MKTIINGIKNENPIFVLLLGLCPTLALTHTFESAYIMGIFVLIVLIFSNFTVSLIKNLIPDNVRIPVYIIIIATFVTVIDILIKEYTPQLHVTLGIYLPLITVNCIVLGRILAVATNQKVGKSVLDAIGIGFGFTIALMAIGFFREIIGSNTITLMNDLSSITGYKAIYQVIPDNIILPMNIFKQPAGAFLALAFLMALFNKLIQKGSVSK